MTEFSSTTQAGQPALEAALTNLAEEILCSVVEGGFCMVQDWDHRLDCCIRLDDGRIAGEMVSLVTLNSHVIREVGERLKLRKYDEAFELQNELRSPILISRGR